MTNAGLDITINGLKSLIEALNELILRWEAAVPGNGDYFLGVERGKAGCADDLRELLKEEGQ